MLGRRKKIDRALRERGVPPEVTHVERDDRKTTAGPYDILDAPGGDEPTLDFGALIVPVDPRFEVRLEIATDGSVGGVSLMRDGSILQLGVFAAPRSGGAWDDIRSDISSEIERNGGRREQIDGEFGPELRAAIVNDGGTQDARFIGVDGPRWFLRALIAGPAAIDDDVAADFLELFRRVVVNRGTEPKPVREPLTLQLPAALASQVEEAASERDDGTVEA
ncbi:uncharacterized protein DUF3710 [Antricoccus suffuscus]|uniref:Uncharacterized protein DUF3710 n=1 Tax=Antricoccus suffuscus TaxID=1629062 RepID=A0A2T1A4Y3_9ACTN|nr:DUF3710 domain-containing protein [Antricoccus suffuscus]PRZ43660.1 uncharacterized protein DUF3710 [Antricoccus suffuscus]